MFCGRDTVVDALFLGLNIIKKAGGDQKYFRYFKYLDFSKKIILVTVIAGKVLANPWKYCLLCVK